MRRIVRVPGVCGGRPVFEGTRVEPRHVAAYDFCDPESFFEAEEHFGLTLDEIGIALKFNRATMIDLPVGVIASVA